MKYMSKHEINEFANKYFKGFAIDIYKVSYFTYNSKTEYLINDHYLFAV